MEGSCRWELLKTVEAAGDERVERPLAGLGSTAVTSTWSERPPGLSPPLPGRSASSTEGRGPMMAGGDALQSRTGAADRPVAKGDVSISKRRDAEHPCGRRRELSSARERLVGLVAPAPKVQLENGATRRMISPQALAF